MNLLELLKKIETHFKVNINDVEKKLLIYYDYLKQENQKYNLTNFANDQHIWFDFFWSSLLPYINFDFSNKMNLLDLGSGNGSPGIILKIIFDFLHLTIVEANTKKCNFLSNLVEKLNLKNVKIINDRIENLKQLKNAFDITTARAVAKVEIILELLIPFTKINGYCLLPKGKNYLLEATNLWKQLFVLKSKLIKIDSCIENNVSFNTLIIKKIDRTSSIYPRKYSAIKKGFFSK